MRVIGLIFVTLFLCSSCENNERRDAIDMRQVEAMGCVGAAPVTYQKWPANTSLVDPSIWSKLS
jgi:hypothetical protein